MRTMPSRWACNSRRCCWSRARRSLSDAMDEKRRRLTIDSGWNDSAAAYIAFQDRGDPHRKLLLDPVMVELCGDVRGRGAVDVGCGEGRFSRMLADRGASVVGIDATLTMIAEAIRRSSHRISYCVATTEHLPLGDASFDLCISYVTLVDIVGYGEAIEEMA